MSQTCNNLATKAELEALANELNALLESKVDDVEKASIINVSAQQGLGLAASLLLPKITKALAGLAALAAKISLVSGAIAFLVAQIAALALLQYQITRNSRKIESNRRSIERNSARTINNEQKIASNAEALRRQQSEISTIKTDIRRVRRDVTENNRAIAINNRATIRNEVRIRNAEISLARDVESTEASLQRDIESAEASLQRQVRAANANLQAQIGEINSLFRSISTGYQASIADLSTRFTSQIQSTSRTLARTQGQVTELQVRLALATGNAVITRRRVATNSREVERVRRRVGGGGGNFTDLSQPLQDLGRSLNNTTTVANTNTAGIANTNNRVNDLTNRLGAIETARMDTTQVNRLRGDIASDTQNIVATAIGSLMLPRFNELRRATSPPAIASATNDALCQQANNPSSCLNTRITNPIQNNLGNIVNGLGAGASAANTALNTNILRRVTDIQNKVNNSQFGLQATRQFLQNAWNSTIVDKTLNAMNTALALHNAAMLSRNLGQSVGEVASSFLNAIGVRDSENNEIDVNTIVTNQVRRVANAVFGTQTTQTIINSFNAANRILVAGQGVIGSVRGVKDALQNGQEIIANRVGYIGNSFLEQGILEEDSFRWMQPNLNLRNPFSRVTGAITNLQEVVDETNELVQTGIEVQEGFGEIVAGIDEFSEARTELEEILDEFNDDKQEEEDNAEIPNASPDITNRDLIKDEE